MVRQAEALYDTLMKAKSGPAQSSKPASANWASAGWKRGADSGNAGVFVAVQCCVYIVHMFCSAHCTGNYQKWQRTGELPTFTRAEVAKHNSVEKGVWVPLRGGVYDITEFVQNWPD